jgi:regulator of RNase E activity RraA
MKISRRSLLAQPAVAPVLSAPPALVQTDTLTRYTLGQLESSIARLGRRPRGEGVTLPGLQQFGARIAGAAIPVTVSTDSSGPRRQNVDWWKHVEKVAGPKIVVAKDVSSQPGTGAVCGRLTAAILRALGCAGFITDGYVSDTADFAPFAAFAAGLTLRHGDPHIVGWGEPVVIAGMQVSPGDLVVAGAEGAIAFPPAWLSELPAALDAVEQRIQPVLKFCRSGRANAEGIAELLAPKETGGK